MAQRITLSHHLGDERRGREERRRARTAIVHLSLSDQIDNGGDIGDVNDVDLDGVHIVIECDRTDRIGADLGLIGDIAAITDEDRTRDFLVQHDAHLLLQPCDDVEARDVDDIIAIELLLLIHGLRRGDTLEDIEDLIDLALVVVSIKSVASSTRLVSGDIGVHRLDSSERNVLRAVQNRIHPFGATAVEIRGVADSLRIREEDVDVLDAVILSMSNNSIGETTVSLRLIEDGIELVAHELISVTELVVAVTFERIIHTIVSFRLFYFFVIAFAFCGHADEGVKHLLLFFGH